MTLRNYELAKFADKVKLLSVHSRLANFALSPKICNFALSAVNSQICWQQNLQIYFQLHKFCFVSSEFTNLLAAKFANLLSVAQILLSQQICALQFADKAIFG